jgi:hypothetical protein
MQSRHTRTTGAVLVSLTAALTLGACGLIHRPETTVESSGDVAATTPVTPANNRAIPAGATIVATLDQALGTKISKAGEAFTATVGPTLYAQDGSVVVPAGARIEGHVTALDDSDNATEPALIRLAFDRVTFYGRSYPFAADIVQAHPVENGPSKNDRTKQIVIGGAVGAALGGLLGKGDLDKIVIGGALGAAAGSIVSLGTEVNATLPAGSAMTLRATQSTILR